MESFPSGPLKADMCLSCDGVPTLVFLPLSREKKPLPVLDTGLLSKKMLCLLAPGCRRRVQGLEVLEVDGASPSLLLALGISEQKVLEKVVLECLRQCFSNF